MNTKQFSHFSRQGEVRMVDVSSKQESNREAIAEGYITMEADTCTMIQQQKHKKGDVLAVARLAGIMAAKKTPDIIPLCHTIPLSKVEIMFDYCRIHGRAALRCQSNVITVGRTGVEMEAMFAVQSALLTVYDMCKSVDRGMSMEKVQLLKKSGGRSGVWEHKTDDRL